MTTDSIQQVIDALHDADVAYIVTVSSERVGAYLIGEEPLAATVMVVQALDELYENEQRDQGSPQVLTGWAGQEELIGMS